MKLFTKRCPAPEFFVDVAPTATPAWHPVTGDVSTVAAAEMDDDGCAGNAHGTYFQVNGGTAPCAVLTAWTYPVCGNPETGGYSLGRKYEYVVYRDGRPPWFRADWHATGDTTMYPDLGAASRAARDAARVLAWCSYPCAPDGGSLTGFDWDGAPW